MRLHCFALFLDDAINVRVGPTLGDHLGPCKTPRLVDPVVRFIRLNGHRHPLPGRNATPRELGRHLSGGAFNGLRFCPLRHDVLYATGGAEASPAISLTVIGFSACAVLTV